MSSTHREDAKTGGVSGKGEKNGYLSQRGGEIAGLWDSMLLIQGACGSEWVTSKTRRKRLFWILLRSWPRSPFWELRSDESKDMLRISDLQEADHQDTKERQGKGRRNGCGKLSCLLALVGAFPSGGEGGFTMKETESMNRLTQRPKREARMFSPQGLEGHEGTPVMRARIIQERNLCFFPSRVSFPTNHDVPWG